MQSISLNPQNNDNLGVAGIQSRENSARNSDDSQTYSHSRSNRGSILRQSKYGGGPEKPKESHFSSAPQESVSKKGQADDKKDKISFKHDIQEIKVVENWKEYNNDDYQNTTCHCCTF